MEAGLGGTVALYVRSRHLTNLAKEFNDAQKYGPHAELYFFLLRNMRCETDLIEPGHVSIERPIFTFPFAQPEGLLPPARNDHLCQLALDRFS